MNLRAQVAQAERELARIRRTNIQLIDINRPAWSTLARPDQLPPPGDNWRSWLLVGGRGSGKSRTAAETIARWVRSGRARRIAIVGRTFDDVRTISIPDLQAAAGPEVRYSRSNHDRLRWPNGALAYAFSAEQPASFRGHNFDTAWLDELAAFKNPQKVFDLLQLALRVPGAKQIITTTPAPMALLRELMAHPSTVVTPSRTTDNAENLDPATLDYYMRFAGTRLGREELLGELLDDPAGGLWEAAWIDRFRVTEAPALVKIVVAIDPALGGGRGSDETGIIVAGKDSRGHGYVLADRSGRMSPDGLARVAVSAYREFGAEQIVAEENLLGGFLRSAIESVDPTLSYRGVRASQSKLLRAAPIAALYEQGRVHHVGTWLELEDQLCTARLDSGSGHDDRLDALVWAFTDLDLTGSPLDVPGVISWQYGVVPCACGHYYPGETNPICPKCKTPRPATY